MFPYSVNILEFYSWYLLDTAHMDAELQYIIIVFVDSQPATWYDIHWKSLRHEHIFVEF